MPLPRALIRLSIHAHSSNPTVDLLSTVIVIGSGFSFSNVYTYGSGSLDS